MQMTFVAKWLYGATPSEYISHVPKGRNNMAPDRGNQQRDSDAIAKISSRESDDTTTNLRKVSTEEDMEDDELSAVEESQKFLAEQAEQAQNFTLRGVLVGLAIGVVICFSNTYFGLQTGWVSGMTMPAALIGFAFFKNIAKHIELPFTPVENVLVQTVAGAVGTMPLGCGFVGVLPALNYLLGPEENGPLRLPAGKLILWSLGICFFGVVFAVPLRKEVIIREKLKFPSGTATALIISVLHGDGDDAKIARHECGLEGARRRRRRSAEILRSRSRSHDMLRRSSSISGIPRDGASNFQTVPTMSNEHTGPNEQGNGQGQKSDWKTKIRLLTIAFGVSAVYVGLAHTQVSLRILIFIDLVIILRSTITSSPNFWVYTSKRLAVDIEPFACVRRPGHNHGASDHSAHASRSPRWLGHIVAFG